jgi:RNA-directed DNA polymerase
MGLFDWLFGKKNDPYGNKPGKDYGDAPKPYNDQPKQYQSAQKPYQAPPKTYGAPPAKPGERTEQLSFRQARSNKPLDSIADQNLGGMNPITGKVTGGPLSHLGGTRESPDQHTDLGKLRDNGLPEIAHLDDLAELVGTTRNEIIFLASRPQYSEPTHYTIKELPKKSGGTRLLMVPMPRMKAVQRALNAKLISRLPVHEAAHGFRKGRDVLTSASPHVGKDVVVSVDIEDFFPSFTFRRVSGYFRNLGYGRGTSVVLANLTTARLRDASKKRSNRDAWMLAPVHNHVDAARRYHPEIPQGAPTSPGLANAISRRMDKRLHALAQKFGAEYTRYADDLTFSGNDELAKSVGNLLQIVRQIVRTEGLRLNEKKTRIMRKGRQQRVTGVVVNQQTNVSRREFDKLKAILHNCIKHGPDSQNRENVPDFREHLRGRIAHITHIGPERGRKLMRMFEQIRW